jgi:hypothetical protein
MSAQSYNLVFNTSSGQWEPMTTAMLGGGGGGAAADRELVVTTYVVKTAFSGASVGDTITCTQIVDVTGTPSTLSTIWRNQTTGADLGSTPSAANLTLTGAGAATEATLAAQSAKLPASLGPKAGSASLSVAPATDAVFTALGLTVTPTANFNRPADTTAYAVGDLVANSTTAGSVAAMQLSAIRVAAGSGILRRLRLYKSSAGLTNAQFRAHLFSAAPTISAGDNAAIALSGVASYLGPADITLTQAWTDGAWGATDMLFNDLQIKLASGQVVWALLEARAAYTPVSAETFTLVAEFLQD